MFHVKHGWSSGEMSIFYSNRPDFEVLLLNLPVFGCLIKLFHVKQLLK